MIIEEIRKKILTDDYNFLRENKHLGNNVCLLALGGSHAYGMNTEASDLDIRGITLNTKKEILTGDYYEQFTNEETDTVIYSFNKIITLLSNCNPNVIEIFGCRPEHYLYISDAGKILLENKRIFLSKRCTNSFGGYANQQLRRLQNAMARDSYPKTEREKHILNTIRNMRYHFKERYPSFSEENMCLYIANALTEGLEEEIFIDLNLKHYPLRDYRGIMAEMNTVINEYSKLNKRNTKKDVNHLAKHMAHLLRLYMMAIDLLEKGEIITYRENEHDILIKTRNKGFLEIADDKTIEKLTSETDQMRADFKKQTFEDELEYEMAEAALESNIDKIMTGIYKITDDFWDLFNDYEKKFDYAKKHTELPDSPDYEKINLLQETINLSVITNN